MAKEGITNLMKSSICLIKIEKYIGTGTFIKLPIPSKENPMYGLMTNNHVLESKHIKPGNSFIININGNEKEIHLNEHDFIFTSEFIDVTFIQLNNKSIGDIMSICPSLKFIEPRDNGCSENERVYIFQYPEGVLSYANGRIQSISGFNYFHIASTKGGSSGSPLLNKNMDVIGIHKAGIESEKQNVATKMNIINYAIRTLYEKRYIYSISKAREPTRNLTENEKKELKNHLLNETEFPNMYKYLYKHSSLVVLFYRTNHAWYYTIEDKKKFKNYEEIYKENENNLNENEKKYKENEKEYKENKEKYEENEKEYKENKEKYEENEKIYKENKKKYEEYEKKYKENKEKYEENEKEYKENKRKYEEYEKKYKENKEKYEENEKEYKENKEKFKNDKKKYKENEKKFKKIEKQFKNNVKKFKKIENKYKENEKKI